MRLSANYMHALSWCKIINAARPIITPVEKTDMWGLRHTVLNLFNEWFACFVKMQLPKLFYPWPKFNCHGYYIWVMAYFHYFNSTSIIIWMTYTLQLWRMQEAGKQFIILDIYPFYYKLRTLQLPILFWNYVNLFNCSRATHISI